MGKLLDKVILGYFVLIVLFLYLPIFSVVLFSFNSGSGLSFPPSGFSTAWYTFLFSNPTAIGAAHSAEHFMDLLLLIEFICSLRFIDSAGYARVSG